MHINYFFVLFRANFDRLIGQAKCYYCECTWKNYRIIHHIGRSSIHFVLDCILCLFDSTQKTEIRPTIDTSGAKGFSSWGNKRTLDLALKIQVFNSCLNYHTEAKSFFVHKFAWIRYLNKCKFCAKWDFENTIFVK